MLVFVFELLANINLLVPFSFQKEGFTLTVFSAPQVLKLGTSADFGQCKSCAQVINKYVIGIFMFFVVMNSHKSKPLCSWYTYSCYFNFFLVYS